MAGPGGTRTRAARHACRAQIVGGRLWVGGRGRGMGRAGFAGEVALIVVVKRDRLCMSVQSVSEGSTTNRKIAAK